LSNAVLTNNYRGIMVWYAAVKNGLKYAAGFDASKDKAAQVSTLKTCFSFSLTK
jgi:hypothetical protein